METFNLRFGIDLDLQITLQPETNERYQHLKLECVILLLEIIHLFAADFELQMKTHIEPTGKTSSGFYFYFKLVWHLKLMSRHLE